VTVIQQVAGGSDHAKPDFNQQDFEVRSGFIAVQKIVLSISIPGA